LRAGRWQQIEKIFYSALECETDRRARFLDEACADDLELRKEVESLLAADQQANGWNLLNHPATDNNRSPRPKIFDSDDLIIDKKDLIDKHLIGRRLGEFIIREKLGEGGFGAVYLADQPALAREAVVKVLHEKHHSDMEVIERFIREARLASRLEHPYTASIYAFGAEADGLLWIAMELVRGAPLSKLLQIQGPIPLERFVPLLDKICEVVQTAHEAGIIHRDLKPANVMVMVRAGKMLPKLLDFGIAKGFAAQGATDRFQETALSGAQNRRERVTSSALDIDTNPDSDSDKDEIETERIKLEQALASSAVRSCKTGDTDEQMILTLGPIDSPAYMAPEQWKDSSIVSARTDIYALGALSYEALTGRLPFSGGIGGIAALVRAHLSVPVPPLGPAFSSSIDQVIARAMAKRPEDRFASATEFAATLREAAGLAEQRASLPQLDQLLRDELLTHSPQPLVQAVANLEGARNAHQAREQMLLVFRVAVWYLGLLSLACRVRVGTGTKSRRDSEPVLKTLRKLRQQSLNEAEWLALARELCRPFAENRDTYPIPEMVSLLFEYGSDTASEQAGHFKFLLEMAAKPVQSSSEEQVREKLASSMPRLGALLEALGFLSDYQLVGNSMRKGWREQ
jgi:serine/threonine protein kinase